MSAPARGACEAVSCKAACPAYAEARVMVATDGGWRMCACGHTAQAHAKGAPAQAPDAMLAAIGDALAGAAAQAPAGRPRRTRRKAAHT